MFRVLLDCLKAEAGDPVKEAQTFKQLDLTAKAWLRARVR